MLGVGADGLQGFRVEERETSSSGCGQIESCCTGESEDESQGETGWMERLQTEVLRPPPKRSHSHSIRPTAGQSRSIIAKMITAATW
jgi:hypothetical protein